MYQTKSFISNSAALKISYDGCYFYLRLSLHIICICMYVYIYMIS